jgi:hypothetical protein
MKQWKLLYTTNSLPQASIVKGMLEENNVPVMLINKQDSSYVNFGEIELHVPFHLQDLAQQLMHQALGQ